MAQFTRRTPPPGPFVNYQRFKSFLREDFRFQCAYCNITEAYRRGSDVFGVDHFRPRAHFPDLATTYSNLYYACNKCNSIKGSRFPTETMRNQGIGFVDPCAVNPHENDLREAADGKLEALTGSGTYTIAVIRLNRIECVTFRLQRRRTAARIAALRGEIEALDPHDRGTILALEALHAAEQEWEACFGSHPGME
ncbi:MAG: HNH endonuclease [Bryobacteraceae bacterium]